MGVDKAADFVEERLFAEYVHRKRAAQVFPVRIRLEDNLLEIAEAGFYRGAALQARAPRYRGRAAFVLVLYIVQRRYVCVNVERRNPFEGFGGVDVVISPNRSVAGEGVAARSCAVDDTVAFQDGVIGLVLARIRCGGLGGKRLGLELGLGGRRRAC